MKIKWRSQGDSKRSGRRAWRRLLPILAAGFVILGATAVAQEIPVPGERVDGTRAVLEKWVETRRLIAKEKRDWALGKEMLNERIDLVKREIETLRKRVKDAEDNIADADKKRNGLVEQNDRLKEVSNALSETVLALEERTKALLKRLPDPIRERVKPLSQRLPDDTKEIKQSLPERFQNVVGILNEVNKFNGEITVASEVRKLGEGTTAEVMSLYVGIGQGYYLSTNGKAAGVGTATADGWVWRPANDVAPQIAEAIAIMKNEKPAAFVRVPVRID